MQSDFCGGHYGKHGNVAFSIRERIKKNMDCIGKG